MGFIVKEFFHPACALENVFLAAHALGVGSVWINQLKGACDRPGIRAALAALSIPDDHVAYGIAAMGYPVSAPAAMEKRRDAIVWA